MSSKDAVGGQSVVEWDDWVESRRDFLIREKEFTRFRDDLSRERRQLLRFEVTEDYVFEGPSGTVLAW